MNRLFNEIVIGLFIITAISIPIIYRYAYYPIIAQGLTRNKIQSIVPGIKCKDAINMLGTPISFRQDNTIDSSGKKGSYTTYSYASSGILTEQFEVYMWCEDEISAAMVVEHNDYGVYYCTVDKCPGIMQPILYEKLGEFLHDKYSQGN